MGLVQRRFSFDMEGVGSIVIKVLSLRTEVGDLLGLHVHAIKFRVYGAWELYHEFLRTRQLT